MVFDSPDGGQPDREYRRITRIVLLALLVMFLLALFIIWRLEGDRAERVQMSIMEFVLPAIELGQRPGELVADIGSTYRKYTMAAKDYEVLEVTQRKLREWQTHAQLLEQENAALRKLVNMAERPDITVITAPVIADTRSPFRNSILVNLGSQNGVANGWMATDGIGVVGRVTSVGQSVSRIVLLLDTSSRVPGRISVTGSRALVVGNNTMFPNIELFGDSVDYLDGSRVITSGDAGVYPPGYLIGTIHVPAEGEPRVVPAADFSTLSHVTLVSQSLPVADNLLPAIIGNEQTVPIP